MKIMMIGRKNFCYRWYSTCRFQWVFELCGSQKSRCNPDNYREIGNRPELPNDTILSTVAISPIKGRLFVLMILIACHVVTHAQKQLLVPNIESVLNCKRSCALRLKALAKIDDQETLYDVVERIGWYNNKARNRGKCKEDSCNAQYLIMKKAIEKIYDQHILENIAKNAILDVQTRIEAIKRLNNKALSNELLFLLLKLDYASKEERLLAAYQLSNDNYIMAVIKNRKQFRFSKEEVSVLFKNISNEQTVIGYFKDSLDHFLIYKAALHITNQEFLKDILVLRRKKIQGEVDYQKILLGRITDEELLFEVAKHSNKPEIQVRAIERITNEGLLSELALMHLIGIKASGEALKRITNQDTLRSLLEDACHAQRIQKALQILNFVNDNELIDINAFGLEPGILRNCLLFKKSILELGDSIAYFKNNTLNFTYSYSTNRDIIHEEVTYTRSKKITSTLYNNKNDHIYKLKITYQNNDYLLREAYDIKTKNTAKKKTLFKTEDIYEVLCRILYENKASLSIKEFLQVKNMFQLDCF